MNNKWMKKLGIGLILLFLVTSVLPSIIAGEVPSNAYVDRSIHSSSVTAILIFVGSIKNSNVTGDYVFFESIRVVGISFVDGHFQEATVLEGGYPFWCYYDTKIGFVGKHFICAIFKLTG